jgi:hypothetical protein
VLARVRVNVLLGQTKVCGGQDEQSQGKQWAGPSFTPSPLSTSIFPFFPMAAAVCSHQ